jgi:hypothetical protein
VEVGIHQLGHDVQIFEVFVAGRPHDVLYYFILKSGL